MKTKIRNGSADSPATLVAICVAARRVGDRDLERAMRNRLQDEHGIKLVFVQERQEKKFETPRAN